MAIIAIIAIVIIAYIIVDINIIKPRKYYAAGLAYMENREYQIAYEAFLAADGYEASNAKALEAMRAIGDERLAEYDYSGALEAYEKLPDRESWEKRTYLQNILYILENAREITTVYATEYSEYDLPMGVYAYSISNPQKEYYPDSDEIPDEVWGLFHLGEDAWFEYPSDYCFITRSNDYTIINFDYLINSETGDCFSYSNADAIYGFSEGKVRYAVRDDESNYKYGYMDLEGNVLIEPQYDSASDFNDGRASVKVGDAYSYIDESGNLICDFIYEKAGDFHGGYANVYVDTRYEKVGNIYIEIPDGWGVIDKDGNVIVEPVWEYVETYDSYSGDDYIGSGIIFVKENGLAGLVSTDGKLILEPTYSKIEAPVDGICKVMGVDEKYGLISVDGSTILPAIYDYIYDFSDGLAYVYRTGKNEHYFCEAGYVDSSGKMVIDLVSMGYNDMLKGGSFQDGIAVIKAKQNGEYCSALIDKTGKLLVPMMPRTSFSTSVSISRNYENELIVCVDDPEHDSENYYVYENGKLNARPARDTAFWAQWETVFFASEEGICRVRLGTKSPNYGFVTEDQEILAEPIYEDARNFESGMAAVCIDGNWGFIDSSGAQVIDAQYREVSDFINNVAWVYDDSYKLINKDGEVLAEGFYYSSVNNFMENGSVILQFSKSDWRIFDSNGTRLL